MVFLCVFLCVYIRRREPFDYIWSPKGSESFDHIWSPKGSESFDQAHVLATAGSKHMSSFDQMTMMPFDVLDNIFHYIYIGKV